MICTINDLRLIYPLCFNRLGGFSILRVIMSHNLTPLEIQELEAHILMVERRAMVILEAAAESLHESHLVSGKPEQTAQVLRKMASIYEEHG